MNIEAALEIGGSRGGECGERGVATASPSSCRVAVLPVTVSPLLTDAPPESVAAPLSGGGALNIEAALRLVAPEAVSVPLIVASFATVNEPR